MKKLINYINENSTKTYVNVIVEFNKQILVLQRAYYMKRFKGEWGIPGGSVEVSDKSINDAAVRELIEETGIHISPDTLKYFRKIEHENGNISHILVCNLKTEPEIYISREHIKYSWVSYVDDRKWMKDFIDPLTEFFENNITENFNFRISRDTAQKRKKITSIKDFKALIDDRAKLCVKTNNNLLDVSDINLIDLEQNENFYMLFVNANQIFKNANMFYEINVSNLDITAVKEINCTFYNCNNATKIIGLDTWNFSGKDNLDGLFSTCINLEDIGDVSNWNIKDVTSLFAMFFECQSLTEIKGIEKWQFDDLRTTKNMFYNCKSLEKIDISNWGIQPYTEIISMFLCCAKLKDAGDLNSLPEPNNAILRADVFTGCKSLKNIPSWYSKSLI